MRTARWLAPALFVVAGGVLLQASTTGSRAEEQAEIASGSTSVEIGTTGQVSVRVSSLPLVHQDANAFEIKLNFDPSVLDVQEILVAPLWTSVAGLTQIQNAEGWVRVVGWRITTGAPGDACGDPCMLFELTVKGKANGQTLISIAPQQLPNAVLADAGEYVDARWASGVVSVGAGGSPTATSTAVGSPSSTVPPITATAASATPSSTATPTPVGVPASTTPTPPSETGRRVRAWISMVSRE